MKISLIIPPEGILEGGINFMFFLYDELRQLRHDVLVNRCEEDCDFLIGMTHNEWIALEFWHKRYPNVPLITYNWDWYDYTNKTKDGWAEFIQLMKESVEVWSSSEITAKKCKKDTGIKSDFYGYGYIQPWEWEGKKKDMGYAMQSSRKDPNKRFDWFYKACQELEIPYRASHPKEKKRKDYIHEVKNCSVMVLSSKEESIGGLTLLEAAYCGKPILTGDHEGAKEMWGDTANYFKVNDFNDYKKQLNWLWKNKDSKEVQDKAKRAKEKVLFPKDMAKKIHERLLYLKKKINYEN